MRLTVCVLTLLLISSIPALADPPTDSPVFQRIFGLSRLVPADVLDRVSTLEPGEHLPWDSDGDGTPDGVWYFDTAKRHDADPLLVFALDEDGDLAETSRPDLDSDCYFWDHGADGYIDVVTDYVDDDGDGDLDQMGIFYDKNWKDDKDDFTVWWSVDIGDDNKLWFDVNGNYYQRLCQWRTHFSGDELFYQFRLTDEDERWVNVWEDPFAFYDVDDDECSEMVIRISAIGDEVKNLRYSIDADDDAHGRRTHNYDFSVTALPPEKGLAPDPALTQSLTIRGIETHPALTWKDTPAFAQNAAWGQAMFIWDEINSNTDQDPNQDPHERWEGLLNHASKHDYFPQVGGPPCSAFNKRFEVTANPASPLSLYWDEADHRFHLLGAEYGYMDVDFDLDGEVDAHYTWTDTNGDGLLDQRQVDVDADGTIDIEHALRPTDERFPLTFEAIAPKYTETLERMGDVNQRFFDAALHAVSLNKQFPDDIDEVMDFFLNSLTDYHPETGLGEYIRQSPAGIRFYAELLRDRQFVHVRNKLQDTPQWNDIAAAYHAGDIGRAATLIEATLDGPMTQTIEQRVLVAGHGVFAKRMRVRVTAAGDLAHPLDATPVSIDVAELQERDPHFDPSQCRVVDGNLWLLPHIVPHQVDDWSLGDVKQLHFLTDLPATGEKDYFIYYAPLSEAEPAAFAKITNAVLDNPAYVAWESDVGAFRAYTGQFDFFGKHEARTLPRAEHLIFPLVDVNYHAEQDWGIDALHVGTTSGLGGLTLYNGDETFPVQSPAGVGEVDFEYRVLGSGPIRSAVEIVATNVLPEAPDDAVTIRAFIYAGHAESEIQVQLPEAANGMQLAPGLMRIASDTGFSDAARGLLGEWGYHGDDIGEIGMAVIVPPTQVQDTAALDAERRFLCDPQDGPADLRYWILGGWRRGMQYPVGPTLDNWRRTTEELADRLHTPIEIMIGDSDTIVDASALTRARP